MRAPLSKIYRAFPELDRFEDADCERFMAAVRAQRWHRLVRFIAAATVGFGGFVITAMTIGGVANLVVTEYLSHYTAISVLLFMVALVAIFALPAMPSLMVRDWLLRRRIKAVLTEGNCPICRYSLLGLPADEAGKVQCSECGFRSDVDPAIGKLAVTETGRQIYLGRE